MEIAVGIDHANEVTAHSEKTISENGLKRKLNVLFLKLKITSHRILVKKNVVNIIEKWECCFSAHAQCTLTCENIKNFFNKLT